MSLAYFPLFPDDFEADTAHLTLAEDGAYNRLLRLCWRTPGCSVPNDMAWIYRRLRALSDDDRAVIDTVVDEFFTASDGRLSNARLTKEWLAANEAHERRKNAGAKGGKAKSRKTNDTGSSNATAKPKQPEPEPEPYKEVGANAPTVRKSRPERFQEFWDTFPHRHGAKKGKATSEKKYAAAVRSGVPEQSIIDAARAYRSDADVLRGYGKGPEPWLNQRCWEDEIATNVTPIQPRKDKPSGSEIANRVAARFAGMDRG